VLKVEIRTTKRKYVKIIDRRSARIVGIIANVRTRYYLYIEKIEEEDVR